MKRAFKLADPVLLASLDVYKEKLTEYGYSNGTIRDYISSTGKYLETGLPITKEAIEEYFEEKLSAVEKEPKKKRRIHAVKAGVLRYYEIFYGDEAITEEVIRARRIGSRKVCDEDCFNCKYPDCIFD